MTMLHDVMYLSALQYIGDLVHNSQVLATIKQVGRLVGGCTERPLYQCDGWIKSPNSTLYCPCLRVGLPHPSCTFAPVPCTYSMTTLAESRCMSRNSDQTASCISCFQAALCGPPQNCRIIEHCRSSLTICVCVCAFVQGQRNRGGGGGGGGEVISAGQV